MKPEVPMTTEHNLKMGLHNLLAAFTDDKEILENTPQRFLNMFAEMTSGMGVTLYDLFRAKFKTDIDELVVVRDIEFASLCQHHLMPFFGKACVGYLPRGQALGLSKVARVVERLSRGLWLQENLTVKLAYAFASGLECHGVGVVLDAVHTCITCRGAKKNTSFVTSCLLGCFREDPRLRQEFLSFVYRRG